MASPDESPRDIFLPGGRVDLDRFTSGAAAALRESVRLARETNWDSVRSPHVFMGLLAAPDAAIRLWGTQLQIDLARLRAEFQQAFARDEGDDQPFLILSREFLSDNALHLLRAALHRAQDKQRERITTLDLLISLLTFPGSIVAEFLEHSGCPTARLVETAENAEGQIGRE
jgi:ATP-dependent Clp protease ATP-binding subunit ClpA